MPGTDNKFGFDKIDYAATNASCRFASRHVKRYRSGSASAGSDANARKSPFALAARLDGQSLAGTGALVFEGELLEKPRH